MRTFSDPSLFRLIHALMDEARADHASAWTHRGVAWTRERHSFSGAAPAFAIQQVVLTRPGATGWTLLVVREHWWSPATDKALRSAEWAKPLAGGRAAIWEWLRLEERRIDRMGPAPGQAP
jgi:hypothetical protein